MSLYPGVTPPGKFFTTHYRIVCVCVCVLSLTTLLHENTSPRSRVARQSPPSAVAPTGHVTDAQAHAVGLAVYATCVRSRLRAECAECETGVEHSEVDHAADSVHLRSEVSAVHQATHAAPGRHETRLPQGEQTRRMPPAPTGKGVND